MVSMILKMTGMTTLYTLLTVFLWMRTAGKPMTALRKIIIGVIFGICAVLSTHFGVDFNHMMVNVRDIGPLSAGLFFDPVSGVIAGLIGGIERYIAGTYWGIGSYTCIACSVSTCLAGIVAAVTHVFVFKRTRPSALYALFMGAVMEVFHMYVVLITHRNDMDMAFYVVRTCSVPMIVFTALGMAASAVALQILCNEWKNPFRRMNSEDTPVSRKFQSWLFAVTILVLIINSVFTFNLQTQSAIQTAHDTLTAVSGDIAQTYVGIERAREGIRNLSESLVESSTQAIAEEIDEAGGAGKMDEAALDSLRELYYLESVGVISQDGKLLHSSGQSPLYTGMLSDLISGKEAYQSARLSSNRVVAGACCIDGFVQCVIDTKIITDMMNQSGLDDTLSLFHIGSTGSFDIISPAGFSIVGAHRNQILPECGMEYRKGEAEGWDHLFHGEYVRGRLHLPGGEV